MITADYVSEIVYTATALQKDNHIFIYLSPHVSKLELAVNVGGWREVGSKSINLEIYYGSKSYLNPKNIKSKVEEFLSKYAK